LWLTFRIRLRRGPRFKELLFAIDQSIDVVGRQLDIVTVSDRVGRTRFHAVAAKNTSRIIDVVNLGVALTRRYPVCFRVFRGFNVNAIRRARRGAKKTPNAFLQAAFIAVKDVNAAIARLEMHRLIRIILGDRLPEHITEGDTEPLRERRECLSNFADDGRHRLRA